MNDVLIIIRQIYNLFYDVRSAVKYLTQQRVRKVGSYQRSSSIFLKNVILP